MKYIKIILLSSALIFQCFLIAHAQEVKEVAVTDTNGIGILDEEGHKILSEYVEVCREKGKFIKCPKEGENNGFIKRKIERRCRDGANGRFIQCPKDK